MLISENKLRTIIREEIVVLHEASAPADPFGRAGKRFLDAVDRKGIDGALRDTMLRVDKIKSGSPKAMGIVKWMTDYLRTSAQELSRQQKKILKTIIRNAKHKAG